MRVDREESVDDEGGVTDVDAMLSVVSFSLVDVVANANEGQLVGLFFAELGEGSREHCLPEGQMCFIDLVVTEQLR